MSCFWTQKTFCLKFFVQTFLDLIVYLESNLFGLNMFLDQYLILSPFLLTIIYFRLGLFFDKILDQRFWSPKFFDSIFLLHITHSLVCSILAGKESQVVTPSLPGGGPRSSSSTEFVLDLVSLADMLVEQDLSRLAINLVQEELMMILIA